MQGETAPSRKIVEVHGAKVERPEKGNLVLILAITDPPLLQKVGTEQIRQTLRAPTAVHKYTASEVRVRE